MVARVSRSGTRGFTLVELAVVVVIVGILSVVAVVGYRKLTLSSKVTEAQNMVGNIRLAEEDYKAEKGTYYSTGSAYCPQATPTGQVKSQWDSSCAGNKWQNLAVHPDGPVLFGYRVLSAPDSKPTITGIDLTNLSTTKPWFVVDAKCDIDPGGLATQVVVTSGNNTPFVVNAGE